MSETQLTTPILVMIYNRPDTAQEVFNAIKKVHPKKLYVASDAPRPGKLEDISLCQQARDILQQIDWDCELHTRFLEQNLGGCDPAVRSEISWFFEQEDEGIILEDDCVPNEDFFIFCEVLLDKYRNDPSVMMIGGFNPIASVSSNKLDGSYYFSKWATIWGWATWRRAWVKLDTNYVLAAETISGLLTDPHYSGCPEFRELFACYYGMYSRNVASSPWDVQWCYTLRKEGGLCVVPRVNLVSNIGQFGYHAHDKTGSSPLLYLPTGNLPLPLSHPEQIIPNKVMDEVRVNQYVRVNRLQYYILKLAVILRRLHLLTILPHPLEMALTVRKIMFKK